MIKPLLPACYQFFPELNCINQYRYNLGRMPNLINPKTFNEKVLRKLLFDRDPKLTLFADKYLVRDYVKSKLGTDGHLTKLYAVIDGPAEISGLGLPSQFVMKANHLSGVVKIVRDSDSLAKGELEDLASKWLQKNYYDKLHEWAYKNIKPRIIFEELLEFNGNVPDDWRFFCFRGEPRFIQVDIDRFIDQRRNFYDMDLTLLPVKKVFENFQRETDSLQNYDKMLEIARKLSAGTDFIRVDLYNIQGRILFGELTNYPSAGLGKFNPSSWDTTFGSYWKS